MTSKNYEYIFKQNDFKKLPTINTFLIKMTCKNTINTFLRQNEQQKMPTLDFYAK